MLATSHSLTVLSIEEEAISPGTPLLKDIPDVVFPCAWKVQRGTPGMRISMQQISPFSREQYRWNGQKGSQVMLSISAGIVYDAARSPENVDKGKI
jgi:hypothetical protein